MPLKRYRQVSGFILAGGASSRMGIDKGLLEFGGVPLLCHTARLLKPLVAEVNVVGSPHRYAALDLRTFADSVNDTETKAGIDRTGCGPLAGIAAALSATHSYWNLIVACDMPYLSAKWLRWLLSRAINSHAEAIVPQTEHGLEPLAAVYHRECRPAIVAALASGVRKVTDAIRELRLEVVNRCEWQSIDPAGLVLKNMNAPEDYNEALKWWTANQARQG